MTSTTSGKKTTARRKPGRAPHAVAPAPANKRIAVFIVAYNAQSTLAAVLDRIPESFWERVAEVFVFDDSSQDETYEVGLAYKAMHGRAKLNIFRHEKNLGYGGNQIAGYRYAIKQGYDIVALLHGDGQYAPEALPALVAPLERGEADAVFGSRMMTPGGALRGGMPLYKYVGNRILSTFENALLGLDLSEFHSGYRLYSVEALKAIPFAKNTHDFHFDTQIIIQLHAAGKRIVEVPIPTYYGDEICHVNGMKYARDVVRSVVEYELHELGIAARPEYAVRPIYDAKQSKLSSHAQLLAMVGPDPRRVLDLGCGAGQLAGWLRRRGHHVVGVDMAPPQVELDAFIQADVSGELALPEGALFDVILLADVLEHLVDPAALLRRAQAHLAPGGRVLVSLPNTVHWSVRGQIAAGRFEYTNKGLLDRSHLRFFTRRSALQLFDDVGLRPREVRATPVPWEKVVPKLLGRFVRDKIEKTDYLLTKLNANLFAYQHLFELVRKSDP